jgi:hypothetical protein
MQLLELGLQHFMQPQRAISLRSFLVCHRLSLWGATHVCDKKDFEEMCLQPPALDLLKSPSGGDDSNQAGTGVPR